MEFELKVEEVMKEQDFREKETDVEGLVEVLSQEVQWETQAGEEERKGMEEEVQTETLEMQLQVREMVEIVPTLQTQTLNIPAFVSMETLTYDHIPPSEPDFPSSSLLKSPLFPTKTDEYFPEIDNFEEDLQKIFGSSLTSEQLEAIEESLYRRLSAVWQIKGENNARRGTQDSSGLEPFHLTPKEIERNEGKSDRKSRKKSPVMSQKRGKEGNMGLAIIRRFRVDGRRMGRVIPRKMLVRVMEWTFAELVMRKKEVGSESLATVLFDLFTQKYGFEQLAERKMRQVAAGCFAYKEDKQVNTFARLLGLWEPFSPHSFHCYLKALDFTSKFQYCIELNGEDQVVIPLPKAFDCLKTLFEPQLPSPSLVEFKQTLENAKITDAKGYSKGNFLDLSLFLQELLQFTHNEEVKNAVLLRTLFTAANVILI